MPLDLYLSTGAKKVKVPLDLPGLSDHLAPNLDSVSLAYLAHEVILTCSSRFLWHKVRSRP